MMVLTLYALLFTFCASAELLISSVQTSVWDGYVFVRVQASSGEYGWGQCTYPTLNDATLGNLSSIVAQKIHEWISPIVLGRNISSLSDLFQISEDAWESNYKNTGTLLAQSLAGVDTALWDLFAKSNNVPVFKLLGECRKEVKIYAS
eukprot:UN24778